MLDSESESVAVRDINNNNNNNNTVYKDLHSAKTNSSSTRYMGLPTRSKSVENILGSSHTAKKATKEPKSVTPSKHMLATNPVKVPSYSPLRDEGAYKKSKRVPR